MRTAGSEFNEDDWTFYIVAAGICAFFAAFGIGANDVANAYATSVGSKAITVRQAVMLAAVFEFAGDYYVTHKRKLYLVGLSLFEIITQH